MVTATPQLLSAADRPVSLRTRPDLVVRRQSYQGDRAWVIKDPLELKYFRFRDEEYALLTMFDGRASLEEIRRKFETRFAPRRIAVEEIARFLGNLHRSGLVLSDVPGQAEQLDRRQQAERRRRWLSAAGNIFALRFSVLDPDRLLVWLHRGVAWCLSPAAVTISVGWVLAALLLVTVQFDVFLARMPSFHQFFARQNWLWLAVALALTKIMHEFGHALTCKHFGGECHEMGVMFLALTPCLYCNVSDSWLLPSKWQRAAIGAAGMYVELVIAATATFLWWLSAPGLLNQLCLSTMFVSSVSTLVFNANPLLRYDGYYILSDLAEIPNLRQKASTILHRKLGAWCLGLPEPADPMLPQRRQLAFGCYSVAAVAYSWIVVLAIAWFLNKALKPYGLQVIGQAIAAAAVGGMFLQPAWQLHQFLQVPGRLQQVNKRRMWITLGCAACLAAGVLAIPLPHSVEATLEIQPSGAANVYVEVPGSLERIRVRPGQHVEAGEVLAELSNVDTQLEAARLTGEEAEIAAHLAALDRQRHATDEAGDQARGEYPQVRESLESIRAQAAQRLRDVGRLKLSAPVAGTVLPPPLKSAGPRTDGGLAAWSGTPLEESNLGAALAESTLVCRVGDPRRLEAVLVIDQADIEYVQAGQHVQIQLDELPGESFASTVDQVAQQQLQLSSRRLSSKTGGGLTTETDAAGNERPTSTSYQARAPLSDSEGVLRIGLRGEAKIKTDPQTLGTRIWRYLSRTFQFEM